MQFLRLFRKQYQLFTSIFVYIDCPLFWFNLLFITFFEGNFLEGEKVVSVATNVLFRCILRFYWLYNITYELNMLLKYLVYKKKKKNNGKTSIAVSSFTNWCERYQHNLKNRNRYKFEFGIWTDRYHGNQSSASRKHQPNLLNLKILLNKFYDFHRFAFITHKFLMLKTWWVP